MPNGAPQGPGTHLTTPHHSTPDSTYQVHHADFALLEHEWIELLPESAVDHIFLTPYWIAAWWQHLDGGELRLLAIRRHGKLVGVAPLIKREQVFSLAADPDVCDYADIVVRQGEEAGVAAALLDYLNEHSTGFTFSPLPPHSPLLSHLAPLAQQRGYSVTTQALRPAVSLELPSSWEEYLQLLSGKERHEMRRKLRRLHGADLVSFTPTSATRSRLEQFFAMFRSSRVDKEEFLTPQRESFFRNIMREMEERGHLRLYFLELSQRPIAAALCFEYGDTLYLYNNGFDPNFKDLSPGLMSKVLALKDAIELGKRVFDFLGGDEPYKLRMGGTETRRVKLSADRQPPGGEG